MDVKLYQIIGTDKQRGDGGFSVRRYICGEIYSSSPNKALYRWLSANGLKRNDITEIGSVFCKTTYEAVEKRMTK